MEINGMKVIDATKPVTLHILPKDVSKGDNKDPGACAAAQACMRELGAKAARVHIGRTYLQIGKTWVRYKTAKNLRTEIVAFDRGGTFEPGEYMLSPPDLNDRRRAGKRQGGPDKTKRNSRPRIAKKKYHTVTGIRAHGAAR